MTTPTRARDYDAMDCQVFKERDYNHSDPMPIACWCGRLYEPVHNRVCDDGFYYGVAICANGHQYGWKSKDFFMWDSTSYGVKYV